MDLSNASKKEIVEVLVNVRDRLEQVVANPKPKDDVQKVQKIKKVSDDLKASIEELNNL